MITDSLYQAAKLGKLHRNFMGYTSGKTELMLGLGMSAIGDSWTSFAQNLKTVQEYQAALANNQLPIFRGHALSSKDLIIRRHILNLMCKLKTSWESSELYFPEIGEVLLRLEDLRNDGLVVIENQTITIPESERAFVRNVCMAFDLYFNQTPKQGNLFSKTI